MSGTAEQLLDALREFAAGAPTSAGLDVDPSDAATALIALGKAVAVLDGALAGAMARYDRLNAGSPAAILVQHAGLTRTEAANLRRLGRKLETDLPATRENLASGRIGTASARTIADLDEQLASADTPMPQEARRQVEEALADYAADATTTEVTRAARDARYRLTPEPAEREMKDQRETRGITLAKTYGGQTHIAGTADPVTAATILGYLDRNAGRLGPEDTRTAAARRLDALADAVTLAQRVTTPTTDTASAATAPADTGSADTGSADTGSADTGSAAPAADAGAGSALQKSCSPSTGPDAAADAPTDTAPTDTAPTDAALADAASADAASDDFTADAASDPRAAGAGSVLQKSCSPPAGPDAPAPQRSGGAAGSAGDGRGLRESCGGSRAVARPVRARPGPAVTGEDPRGADRADRAAGRSGGGGDSAQGAGRGRLAWRKTSPAHLLIIASHELLTGVPGAAPARLGDGTMIPAETARRHACEAALTRVVLDAPAEPLELGHSTRLFSTSQVRALFARDQGCRWTGCDAPPAACTPHHVTWWANGGTTDVTNGALLCPVHHRMVHEDRWQLRWADGAPGTLVIEAPAHWTLRPPPMTSPPPHTRQPRLPRAA